MLLLLLSLTMGKEEWQVDDSEVKKGIVEIGKIVTQKSDDDKYTTGIHSNNQVTKTLK